MREISRRVGITPQRLYQIEVVEKTKKPQIQEKLITALEESASKYKDACEKTLDYCRFMRHEIFDYVGESEETDI